ncbi:hypothetical protein L5515_015974 [Caenorhabditis briggsae]|uniref:CIP2A N-terminal domain-containing protein n=1 Tax=Caenorhabditis briggsae TaxID=6238 RepID=A0AAE9ED39_CAEBR|nr:hypothetical protein L5515_015974 [Caenorhabditis briggsae]
MERSSFRTSQRFQRDPSTPSNEPDSIFTLATTSAARYVSNSSADNTTRLDEALSAMIRHVADVDRVTRLSLKNAQLKEFLSYTPVILNASTTNIMTRSKFYRLLFSIAHHNIPIRRFMAGELRLLGAVFSCLKASLREQLGPQNMIDILRLLQVLSYEKNVPLEHWANELISFLMQEVIREPEPEWMPYCIAILCNLASASKSACKRIKISSSYKKFSRQLMKLLQHNARIIVVSSLVLIGYLDEKVRDMVYCTENVHDTFMCTFNVLTIGDDECMMTRQIAADLLRRLVVSESSIIPGIPTLASTGKNVLNYGFFIGSIQQTARLLVTLDPRTEESSKIYDLLLAFCSLQQLRSPVCQAIIRCQPTETQLTTPIVAITETCGLKYGESTENVTLKAIKLLSHLLKECIEPQEQMPEIGVPRGQLIELVATCLDEAYDPQVSEKIQKLQFGLRLAEVISHDEQCRQLLLNVCSAHLCQEIATWQFAKNPVVGFLTKPPKERLEPLDPEWTIYGIGIILELCRLLAVLKDHSKVHKDQYWKLLKDERIIPFLAYGISYGDQETVQQAFLTYSHCAQVPAFPSHLLSEMVASCKSTSSPSTSSSNIASQKESPELKRESDDRVGSGEVFFTDERSSQRALDDLLRKVTLEGMPLKDAKTTEVFAAYERKIQMLQLREKELEQQLKNSRPIGVQSTQDFENNSKIRELTLECESLRERNTQLTDHMARGNLEMEQLKIELKDVKQKGETIEQSLGMCITEKSGLKAQLNEILANSERAAQTAQMEISELNAELAQNVARIEMCLQENKDLKREFEEKIVECEVLKEHILQIDVELKTKQTEVERAHLQTSAAEQKTLAKEKELVEAESHLKLYESRLSDRERDLKSSQMEVDRLRIDLETARLNLQKLEQLREAMLSLASSK